MQAPCLLISEMIFFGDDDREWSVVSFIVRKTCFEIEKFNETYFSLPRNKIRV